MSVPPNFVFARGRARAGGGDGLGGTKLFFHLREGEERGRPKSVPTNFFSTRGQTFFSLGGRAKTAGRGKKGLPPTLDGCTQNTTVGEVWGLRHSNEGT